MNRPDMNRPDMNRRVHVDLYRRLTSAYPRKFRDEYGGDLAITFVLQLDEHGPTRCWLRTLRDLATTIPTQHLEARMHHPTPRHASTTCFALAIGTLMAAVVSGTSLYGLIFLLISGVTVTVAVLSRRAPKPALALEKSRSWKKFLIAGSLLLVLLIAAINLPPNNGRELSEVAWSLMMLSLLLSFTLIGAGIVLGATHFSRRHDPKRLSG